MRKRKSNLLTFIALLSLKAMMVMTFLQCSGDNPISGGDSLNEANLEKSLATPTPKYVYHFSQPNVPAPKPIGNPTSEGQLGGFQSVAWNTSTSGVVSKVNHVEATVNKTKNNTIATIQFNQWWGETKAIRPWDGTKFGYDVNNVKASIGCMVSIPQNTGAAIGYATFYLRGYQTSPYIRYWLQFSIMDERGSLAPNFRIDPVTKELSLECQIRNSAYCSINTDSYPFTSKTFPNLRFYGVKISRQQLWNIMSEFKKIDNRILLEPNQHRIFACGVTPELGDLDNKNPQLGTIKLTAENLFLRTEY